MNNQDICEVCHKPPCQLVACQRDDCPHRIKPKDELREQIDDILFQYRVKCEAAGRGEIYAAPHESEIRDQIIALIPPCDCPYCDNRGWYIVEETMTGEPLQEQCRFCHENPNSVFNRRAQEKE